MEMMDSSRSRTLLWIGLLAGITAVFGGIILAFGGVLAGVALVIAGIATLVVLRDIEVGFWGVIGVICLLPFATLPFDIGLTPTFLDLAQAAVVGVWALGIITGKQRTVVVTPITIPLLLFIITAVFSFIFGLNNGPLTPTLLRKFAELILSIFFVLVVIDYATGGNGTLISQMDTDKKQKIAKKNQCSSAQSVSNQSFHWYRLNRLVKAVLIAGAAGSFLAIGLWLLPDQTANDALNLLTRIGYPGGWIIRYIEENPGLAERAIGTAVDPNVLGGLLLMIGSLSGAQLVAKRPLFPKWATWSIFGLIIVALILTFSRGAMLGLIAGLGFIAIMRYRRLIPYMAVGGLLMLFLPFMQDYVARFAAGFLNQDLATQMRWGEYKDALTLIGRYPIFGVGFAGTPDIDIYLAVANVYLTIAGAMGLVGLLAFTAVIVTVFGYAFNNRHYFKQDGNEQADAVWLGLHAALVGGLAAGVFDHYLFNLEFQHAVAVFWLFVGLAVSATRLGEQK